MKYERHVIEWLIYHLLTCISDFKDSMWGSNFVARGWVQETFVSNYGKLVLTILLVCYWVNSGFL